MIEPVEETGALIEVSRTARAPAIFEAPSRISELSHLFHAINALNTRHRPYVLQFIGSTPGEGVTTIATSFVQIAASHQSEPVLFVDCAANASRGATSCSLIDAFREDGSIEAAIQKAPGCAKIRIARLSVDGYLNIDAGDLEKLFDLARKAFPVVVLDCPPARLMPESLTLARLCDGTVLVVGAETTPRLAVAETKQSLERFDAHIIGIVLNQYKNYLPSWFDRWL